MTLVSTLLAFSILSFGLPQGQTPGEVAANPQSVCPLLPGVKAPDVSLVGLNGEAVSLSKVIAQKPSVLVFYRGGW